MNADRRYTKKLDENNLFEEILWELVGEHNNL
jgi:hypothetical protein